MAGLSEEDAATLAMAAARQEEREHPEGGEAETPVEAILEDLRRSGLEPKDMRIRALSSSERAATGCASRTLGYVIPYFGVSGDALPFYRVKVLSTDTEGVKYKQPRKTPNHIYFPPNFRQALIKWLNVYTHQRVLIITEGEKKAACAVKLGFPCVAIGGVDSWRSKTLILPKDTELFQSGPKKQIRAALPASNSSIPELSTLATGFGDLIDLITQHNLVPVIIYDSDRLGTLKAEVQRAATMLAYEFRYLGVQTYRIKQLILPDIHSGAGPEKTALDDFLLHPAWGPSVLTEQLIAIVDNPRAFPKHPNPKGFINVQLEGAVTRKDCQQIALVVLSELDARGMRLRDSATGQPFYYDGVSHRLMPAILLDSRNQVLHESAFGTLIYQEYSLTANDKKVLIWLASQFTGEEPISEVRPKRVLTMITDKEDPTNSDGIAWQVSDSQYFAISSDPEKPVTLRVNGADGILFEQNQCEAMDVDRVLELFDEQLQEATTTGLLPNWWAETLADSNLGRGVAHARSAISGEDAEVALEDGLSAAGALDAQEISDGQLSESGKRMRTYANLLFYISPYLNRWRGIQLPVEIITGEAGSGKTSLYQLRLLTLTGRPYLRNLPADIRDWHSSIVNAGGMHVTDNVNLADKNLRQRLSDEICRIITEPSPNIEQRKLYTNAEQVRIPVSVTFALTSIMMPFHNADLIQRSALFEAQSLGKAPDGDWVSKQVEDRGGREAWIAHHLVFLHLFLRRATQVWTTNFQTVHRLAHLEQALKIAGEVLGVQTDLLSTTIKDIQEESLSEADWTLQGLQDFTKYAKALREDWRFEAADISTWAEGEEEYKRNHMLTSPRSLGRYMKAHQGALLKVVGIKPWGTRNNRVLWIRESALGPPLRPTVR